MAATLTLTTAPQSTPGLSESEAADRLRRDGFNELPSARPRTVVTIALEVVREPMFLLLIAAGGTYLLLGDAEEAIALVAAVFLVIGITLYQEHKTERALDALRDLSSPRALVVRDGAAKRIPGRDVVRGDIVLLREGDRVPADAVVESSLSLLLDESLLTGESVPVRKTAAPADRRPEVVGGDDQPFLYSGTLVVRGEGTGRVYATGIHTELGKIGTALNRVEIGRTALQREVDRVVRVLAVAGLSACVVVGVAYGLSRHQWLDGALSGLTLAIAMVPEEFPVVLTVFLALGAWRISRSRVLTRRIPAVETLGAASVLCVDKTGTLTLNRMTVAELAVPGGRLRFTGPGTALTSEFRRVIETAVHASKPDAFDPMERAIVDCAEASDIPVRQRSNLVHEYPLTDALLAVTHVWRRTSPSSGYTIATKGAPETIATLCGLAGSIHAGVVADINRMASSGLRVIGVAAAAWSSEVLPKNVAGFSFEFLGLIGFVDPVRPGVPAAIEECHGAGIRVVMITGDYAATALNIAREIGLARTQQCITGTQLTAMRDEELATRVNDVDVFARIVPEQKLRLVKALQATGDVVAMTGDGVNDAPALKAADIGIAMGGRGTDVAREAAALVLLDDDFASIVRAVRLGRRIYHNIEKATGYVLAIHVPIAGIALLPVFLGWPLILMPVHVIFMEVIIDPASSIAFEMEREDADVMRRRPRDPERRLFTASLIGRSLLQGIGACLAAAAVLAITVRGGLPEPDVRSLTFATLIMANLALIATNRSLSEPVWTMVRSGNPAFGWIGVGAIALLAAIVYVPALRELFRFGTLHPNDLALVAAAAVSALVWMELTKRAWRTTNPEKKILRVPRLPR